MRTSVESELTTTVICRNLILTLTSTGVFISRAGRISFIISELFVRYSTRRSLASK